MLYTQRDLRWNNLTMGNSSVKLGDAGCAVSALCTLFSFFGGVTTPAQAAQRWQFTPGGGLIWVQFRGNHIESMDFEWRQVGLDRNRLRNATADPRRGSLIQINNGNQFGGNHWLTVLGFGRIGSGNYRCWDPWEGRQVQIHISQITGSAHFIKI